jgi:hypothetical protein
MKMMWHLLPATNTNQNDGRLDVAKSALMDNMAGSTGFRKAPYNKMICGLIQIVL